MSRCRSQLLVAIAARTCCSHLLLTNALTLGVVAGAAMAFNDAVEVEKHKSRTARTTFFPPSGATEGKVESQLCHSRLSLHRVHGYNGGTILQNRHGALIYSVAALVVVVRQCGAGDELHWKQQFFKEHNKNVVRRIL